jgi:hypothetical protein
MTSDRGPPLLKARSSEPRRVAALVRREGRRVALWLASLDAYAVARVEAEK